MEPRIRKVLFQSSGRLRSGWRLVLFLLLLFATVAALMLLLRAAGLRPPDDGSVPHSPFSQLPVVSALVAAILLVSWALLRITDRRSLSTIGLAPRPTALPGALLGLLVGALPVALSVAIFGALGVVSVHPSASVAGLMAPSAIASFVVTSLGAALEELLWRGYLFQLLIEGAGRWIAVLATAIPWALGHADNPGANATGVLYLGLSGILIAWGVIRTGSLWFAIGYHIAWNVTAAHLFGLTTSGFDLGASLLRTTLTGPAWLTGGAFGFEASFITEILDILGLSTALLLAGRVPRIAEAAPYFEQRPAPAGGVLPPDDPQSAGEVLPPG